MITLTGDNIKRLSLYIIKLTESLRFGSMLFWGSFYVDTFSVVRRKKTPLRCSITLFEIVRTNINKQKIGYKWHNTNSDIFWHSYLYHHFAFNLHKIIDPFPLVLLSIMKNNPWLERVFYQSYGHNTQSFRTERNGETLETSFSR